MKDLNNLDKKLKKWKIRIFILNKFKKNCKFKHNNQFRI